MQKTLRFEALGHRLPAQRERRKQGEIYWGLTIRRSGPSEIEGMVWRSMEGRRKQLRIDETATATQKQTQKVQQRPQQGAADTSTDAVHRRVCQRWLAMYVVELRRDSEVNEAI